MFRAAVGVNLIQNDAMAAAGETKSFSEYDEMPDNGMLLPSRLCNAASGIFPTLPTVS
jgi:hypothetical protein